MFLNCGTGEGSVSPLDSKEIKPVNPKGNQPRVFTGRTDAKALILCPPEVKGRFIMRDPDTMKDGSKRKEEGRG